MVVEEDTARVDQSTGLVNENSACCIYMILLLFFFPVAGTDWSCPFRNVCIIHRKEQKKSQFFKEWTA